MLATNTDSIGSIEHVGVLVRDLARTMRHYTNDLGMGPWVVYTISPDSPIFRGLGHTELRLSCYHAPEVEPHRNKRGEKRGESNGNKGPGAGGDPGGRYAVETGTSTFARLAQELAQVLNEGDARGWRVLHIHGFGADYDYALGSTTPVPLCVVWDKQGREGE